MKEKISEIKIIFFASGEFGALILEEISQSKYKPSLVFTNPDKPVGRKKIITSPPVKISAQKNNIPLIQTEKIKGLKPKIENIKPDLAIVSDYKQIIPIEILKIPKFGFINIHPSLLPKYRGPSPIQTTILNGETESGVSLILMDEKIDHGPILNQKKINIPKKIYFPELKIKLAKLGADLIIKTIPKWINKKIKPQTQDKSKATYTKIIKKEDGKIDWSKSAKEIERKIRAFYPWPGAFTFFKKSGKILRTKILEAEFFSSLKENKKGLWIKTDKNDYLLIKKLQPEGKKIMTAEEFKNGYGDAILLRN